MTSNVLYNKLGFAPPILMWIGAPGTAHTGDPGLGSAINIKPAIYTHYNSIYNYSIPII
jgi:hypothetical protein